MIDTHAHLSLCKQPLGDLLDAAESAGITGIVHVGLDLEYNKKTAASIQHSRATLPIYATAGIHPCYVNDYWSRYGDAIDPLAEQLDTGAYIAIGEAGLDYHWGDDNRQMQHSIFIAQLALANSRGLPIIIHSRKAADDTIAIMSDFKQVNAVFHCFSYDDAFVEKTASATRYYSFTGMITTMKNGKLIRALRAVSSAHLLTETDCPYLSPKTYKDQPNQPAYMTETVTHMATCLDMPSEVLIRKSIQNAHDFFNLTDHSHTHQSSH